MKGIKVHTREERNDVIDKVIPLIKSELGENLIALAVSGSFARNEDSLYSDLELLAFTKFDLKKKWELRKIVDGLLVVVVVDTKESYIKKYLDISDVWYASGCDKLVPIINKNLIDDSSPIREKCGKVFKRL
jgi:predicted nucleotidyltransferase